MPDLKPEWRPDGSLVIESTGEIVEFPGSAGLFRFLLVPSSVEELRQILTSPPKPMTNRKTPPEEGRS